MTVIVRRPASPPDGAGNRDHVPFRRAAADVGGEDKQVCGGSRALPREQLLEAPNPEDALTVMETFLIGQMNDGPGPGPAVVAAAGVLARGLECPAEVADRLGLLPRTLRLRFAAHVGLTPKRFGRVQRLSLVRRLDGQVRVDWVGPATRHGYANQAHLAGEFRELVGVRRPDISGHG